MAETAGDDLERGRAAAARGDWRDAFEALRAADDAGTLGPADLPLFGEVAYAAGDLDTTIETWERAHAAALQAGDEVAAAGAAVRVAMHLLFDTAMMAPVRGWAKRAQRLLEKHPASPPHAWLAIVRTYERMLTSDVEGAARWAARALDAATGSGEPGALAVARVAHARTLILQGDVAAGLTALDEAGVATLSGDLDPIARGVVYCELVCALQGLAQYDAAEQWTDAMERWSATGAIGSIHGRCRVHRAEILRLRGAHEAAEIEALAACEELRPFLRRELGWPLTELGRIRLRAGDLDGAEEALHAAEGAGWDPEPVAALLRLARGDIVSARAAILDALVRPIGAPSRERPPNSDLHRAPLLEAQVEIELASGNVEDARGAAGALREIADRFRSSALSAAAMACDARVSLAEGDAAAAQRSFADAARAWTEVGAPYEAALARLGLADALSAGGNDTGAERERTAARAVLDGVSASSDLVPARNELRRDGDVWSVSFAGRAVRVRDLKGMRYLARLLADPDREFHVLDLVAAESGGTLADPGDAGPVLDETAKAAYKRRLAEIEQDIEDARVTSDGIRATQAEAEREFLIGELSRAVGLGGRDRRAASASERARAGVTRAIRQAIARIATHHPPLGEHLGRTIRTGTYCGYFPDPHAPTVWTF